ncbi:MAG TPA: cytochrome P450 [Beijerinckiaceae bacterium]|jgi:cytochrome P450
MFVFDPYSPKVDADPFPFYKTLRDEHPCYRSESAGLWVLSRYDDIAAACSDWRTYSSSRGNLMDELPNRAGGTLGTTDPPRHDQMRACIQHAFSRRGVDGLAGPIAESANRAIDRVIGRRSFDFVTEVSTAVTIDVLFSLLSLPRENERAVRDAAVLAVQTDPTTRRKGPEHVEAFQWLTAYAQDVLDRRRRNPGDDLLSHFLAAEVDGERLTDREVLLTTVTLILAGIESLSGFMTMFALNMCDFPDARRAIVANPAATADAVEESLRFNTSAQRFRRCLTRDVELHGQTMKAGDFVCLAYGSGNRDERRFPNPDVYDVARKPRGHLGFGSGVHTCLGTQIGRLATRVLFETLHARLPDYERVSERLDWMPSTTFRSPLALEIRPLQ